MKTLVMKHIVLLKVLATFALYSLLLGCSINDKGSEYEVTSQEFYDSTLVCINEEINPTLTIREGVVSQQEETIRILRNGEAVAIVRLGEPNIIDQADKEEPWGYFQFPNIFRASENSNLIVRYQMRPDSYTAYGQDSFGKLMSRDEGLTWDMLDREYFDKSNYRVELNNGDVLQVSTPEAKDISLYHDFPKPVNDAPINGYNFYWESSVPDDLRGVYFNYFDHITKQTKRIHASLDDIGLLRYSIDGYMPIVWWGNIKELEGGTLISGVYPTYYLNSEGSVLRTGVSFYKSENIGMSWTLLGTIPFMPEDGELSDSYVFNGEEGFEEPAFEILEDGSFLCVMRTGWTSPMYKAISKDNGIHWSKPEPFTPNGVMPNLLLLGNGVLVLASGRPGLQLRFCIDGDGMTWTEPIEMMHFMDENGYIDVWGRSCGYPSIMPVDSNTFYMVYSDFRTKDINGEYRKSILFRKIEIIKR